MKFARFFIFLSSLALVFPGVSSAREMESFPVVKLQSLDKITARTMTFEANVGNTVKFGSLYIKIQACKKAPPVEQPESAAFLQVWEVRPVKEEGGAKAASKEEAQWIFSGWMFSSSPALSHMDHPVYDVWVLDCLNEKAGDKEQAPPADAEPGEGEIDAGQAPAQPAIQEGGEPADSPAAVPLDTSTEAPAEPAPEAAPETPAEAPASTDAPLTAPMENQVSPEMQDSTTLSPLGD
jgi:hypothetical protein